MSAPTTEILALLDPSTPDTWPQGVLAAARGLELEAQTEAALRRGDPYWSSDEASWFERHWTPEVALAAVRRWRGVVERHVPFADVLGGFVCSACRPNPLIEVPTMVRWPCPDLTETAGEARAYVGGAA